MTDTRPLSDDAAALRATEKWFVAHGLPYFVPEERNAARAALHSRRTLLTFTALVLLTVVGGVVLAFQVRDVATAPTFVMVVLGVAAILYAVTALRARPILTWAVGRTLRSLQHVLPMATRALPLLLVFITFLFINAEVWEVSSQLDGALLPLTVLLFVTLAAVFLVVRLPDELDEADDIAQVESVVEACRRTPMEGRAQRLLDEGAGEEIVARAVVRRFEKANLILVLVIVQAVQVLLLALSVFAFFIVFGALVMSERTQRNWTQGDIHRLDWLPNLSVELIQVSVFLAAFSGLYFTVYAVTDQTYREQFFTTITRELERAVGVATVYRVLRPSAGTRAAPAAPRALPPVTPRSPSATPRCSGSAKFSGAATTAHGPA